MDVVIDLAMWILSAVICTMLFLFWITICEFTMKKFMGINEPETLFFNTAIATGVLVLIGAMIIA